MLERQGVTFSAQGKGHCFTLDGYRAECVGAGSGRWIAEMVGVC